MLHIPRINVFNLAFLVPILLFNAKKNNNYKYHLKTCTILIKYNQSDFLFVINNKHIISYRTTVIFSTHGYWIAYDFTHPAERCPHYINEKCKCACFKISLLKRPENGRDTYIYICKYFKSVLLFEVVHGFHFSSCS